MSNKTRKNNKTGGAKTAKAASTLKPLTLAGKSKHLPKKPATLAKKTLGKRHSSTLTIRRHPEFQQVVEAFGDHTIIDRKALGKRRSSEVNTDRHPEFQELIEAFGVENVLDSFAEFLGREDLKTIISSYDDDDGAIASRRRIPLGEIPDKFSGVSYDGAHWKGYEAKEVDQPRVIYDSYVTELQIPKTMNFCQSYAIFLWAQRGNLHFNKYHLNITFKANEYVENVKKMAKLWLAWFTYQESFKQGKTWLSLAIPQPKFNIARIKHTLRELSTNDAKADEFSKATLSN
jgi:hypothetical protein